MLEGTVSINGENIITYAAANAGPVNAQKTACLYNVSAKGRDAKGYPFDFAFEVVHYVGLGAHSLVGEIMSELHRRLWR